MRSNPPGARVAEVNLESSMGLLAGYLGFENTLDLKGYLDSSPTAKIPIAEFIASKDRHFVMLKKKANWSQKIILEYAYDPNRATWLHAIIPLSHGHHIGRSRGYRTGVIGHKREDW